MNSACLLRLGTQGWRSFPHCWNPRTVRTLPCSVDGVRLEKTGPSSMTLQAVSARKGVASPGITGPRETMPTMLGRRDKRALIETRAGAGCGRPLPQPTSHRLQRGLSEAHSALVDIAVLRELADMMQLGHRGSPRPGSSSAWRTGPGMRKQTLAREYCVRAHETVYAQIPSCRPQPGRSAPIRWCHYIRGRAQDSHAVPLTLRHHHQHQVPL